MLSPRRFGAVIEDERQDTKEFDLYAVFKIPKTYSNMFENRGVYSTYWDNLLEKHEKPHEL